MRLLLDDRAATAAVPGTPARDRAESIAPLAGVSGATLISPAGAFMST